jgi:stage III sporulation protein AE
MDMLVSGYSFDEFQEGLDTLFPNSQINFEGLVSLILKGDIAGAAGEFIKTEFNSVSSQVSGTKNLLIWLIVLGVMSALIMHFTEIFDRHQVADMSFYFLYLMLSAVMLKAYAGISYTACETMENIVLFVKMMVPAYLVSTYMVSGSTTVTLYYQLMLILIYGVEKLLIGIIIPAVGCYLMLSVINGIWIEERLKYLIDFFEKLITWTLKASIGAVSGISIIQSLIAPVADSFQAALVKKTLAAIPGAGNAAESIVNLTAASALVLKNGIGTVLLIILLTMCAAPLLKIFITALIIKCAAALMGIVSDKRITTCTMHTADAGMLLFKTAGTAMLLFLISLSVVTASAKPNF